ncbi:hypothetical protein PLICRDRAFT_34903 [Plicaturopsis crispa FD-325 SS-3]|nr:hypothetical protein PLICRDRAFT_34903 [Plicaturopsis crispa FD-325 SS-3]
MRQTESRQLPPPSLQPPLLSVDDSFDDEPPASPPYRTFASTSQTLIPLASPPYRSQVDLTTMDPGDGGDVGDHKYARADVNRPTEADAKPQPKPTVHYQDGLRIEPPPPMARFESYASASKTSSLAGTDDEDAEDYDWSGEDDLVDEEAKFEQKIGTAKAKPRGCKRIITITFSSLIGSTFLAGLLIAPAVLVHFFWYEKDKTEHRRFVDHNIQAWLFWAAANLIISWYLALIVDLVPIVCKLLVSAAWGHVSEYVKTRMELYDSVKDTVKPLLYAASGWVSWVIIFDNIYALHDAGDSTKSWASYTNRVSQAIEFLFFLALVICAQRMLSHAISFSFHRAAFKDRLDDLRQSLNVIERLRNYRPKRQSNYGHHAHKSSGIRTPVLSAFGFGGHEKGGHAFNEKEHFKKLSGALYTAGTPDSDDADTEGEGPGGKAKGKQKRRSQQPSRQDTGTTFASTPGGGLSSEPPSRSLTPSGLNPHRYPPSASPEPTEKRKSMEESEEGGTALMQAAKVVKTAVLHDARNVAGNSTQANGLMWNVNSPDEAKRLAKAIYNTFKDRGRNYLIPSDFTPAFDTASDAAAAFRVFDKDNNGDLSRAEIKTTLLKVYKERRFLSRSMRDVGAALKTLDRILLFFALVILFFIALSVFGVAVGDSLTSVYTIGIAASFIFKNAASSAFDSIMFLFVTHPFDTGDRCFINEENLVVKKMGLFATVFTRVDGTETYYFNSQLFTAFITNVRRSGKMFENCTIQVAWRTPTEKLDALEKCLNDWLATEENRWFEPNTSIMYQNIQYQRYLELTIGIGHNGTWQDWGLRCQRKTSFYAAVNHYCRQLGIVAYTSPQPIVYADPDTQLWEPSTPLSPDNDNDSHNNDNDNNENRDGERSPSGGSFNLNYEERLDREDEAPRGKPLLGFMPPPLNKTELTRARKSKSRKAAARSTGADGF